ncbi:ras-related protein Rab-4A-like isoform X4 [Tyto alba]|uniref:ras-related protein Rab-4A-like isoform X4 n=1 Tax=Tyto alba TaxID=56313 RepID=UPI001C6756B4|nr:ras-related protein Rab-4A-like isoform X4 [Tyto alba]
MDSPLPSQPARPASPGSTDPGQERRQERRGRRRGRRQRRRRQGYNVVRARFTAPEIPQTAMSETYVKDVSNVTIGVEFGSKIINVGGKYVKLQIWDTAGQERFSSVTKNYYRGAAGALLVYDITSRETYNALTNWLTDARTLASQNIVIILCGNKKDLDADREVTFLEASQFAQENELMFLETSALTGENVEEAFVQCAREILYKIELGELDPEGMGSGIQYGDDALRQLRSLHRAQAQSAQQCGC